MSLPVTAYVGIGTLVCGRIAWQLGAMSAKRWLKDNDPQYQEPGVAAKLLAGGLLTSFGPMSRYAEMTRTKGASPGPITAFWGGLVMAIVGVVVTLASVIR